MKGQTFTTMDGLRGVAAIMVVLLHVPDPTLKPDGGYLAVDLFFALSGFVIAYAYERRLSGPQAVLPFMVVRLIRLYPVYLIGLAIGIGAYLVRTTVDVTLWPGGLAATVAFNGLFLPAPSMSSTSPYHAFPLVFPAWSLFWELAVNAAFALMLPLLSSRVLATLLPLLGIGLVFVISNEGSLDVGVGLDTFALGAVRVSYSFAAGVLLFRLWKSGILTTRLPVWLSLLVLVGVLCAPVGASFRPWFDAVAAIVVFPVLLATSTGAAPSKTLSYLGRLSYPLYVVHAPLMALAAALSLVAGYELISWGVPGTLALILASIAVAVAVDRVDPGLRRLLSSVSVYFGLLRPASPVSNPEAGRLL